MSLKDCLDHKTTVTFTSKLNPKASVFIPTSVDTDIELVKTFKKDGKVFVQVQNYTNKKEPPTLDSKHGKYLPGSTNVKKISTFDECEESEFFSKNAGSVYNNDEKHSVEVREKILVEDDDLDIDNVDDILMCNQYVSKMYESYDKEELYYDYSNIFSNQKFINERMFEILVDWLVSVTNSFECQSETLHLTVHLIREFISKKPNILRQKFQLVGVTCLFIAFKFEEVKVVEISTISQITDKAYTVEEIIRQEMIILSTLNFNVMVPTTITFMCRYLEASRCDKEMVNTSLYAIQRTLQDTKYHKYLYSELAAAAVYVGRHICERNEWPARMVHHTRYTEEHIKSIAEEIMATIRAESQYNTVKRKFTKALGHVANKF